MHFIIRKTKAACLSAITVAIIAGFPLMSRGTVIDIAQQLKEFGLDVVARVISQKVLNSTSRQTVDKIKKTGRDGTGAIVKDWREFVTKSDQRGENIFRAQIAYVAKKNIVCPGSRSALDQVFRGTNSTKEETLGLIGRLGGSLRANNLSSFQSRVKCTIPDKVYKDYQKDFQKGGGWETWSRMVEPYNNPYGLLAMSLDELNTQRRVERKADEGETRSSGFLSKRSPCVGQGKDTQCTFFGKTVTPKQILEGAGVKTVDSGWQWLTASDELSEVLTAVVNAAFQKLDNFIADKTGGLVQMGEVEGEIRQQEQEAANLQMKALDICLRDRFQENEKACADEKNTCEQNAGAGDIGCEGGFQVCLENAQQAANASCKPLCTDFTKEHALCGP